MIQIISFTRQNRFVSYKVKFAVKLNQVHLKYRMPNETEHHIEIDSRRIFAKVTVRDEE